MKFTTILSLLYVSMFALAQTTITYKDHCYKENVQYVYQMVEFAHSGAGGDNQIWDFSRLRAQNKMLGEMNIEKYAVRNEYFPSGNISVVEFGNQFIFETNEREMTQLGFISKDEHIIIKYLKPAVKLKFPMNYTDQFSGVVEMEYQKTGVVKRGDYSVEADAYGTIILPNTTTLNNALRVKSVTNYEMKDGSHQKQLVYRWYVQNERFPVMVLQQTLFTTANGKISSSQKAAYNSLSQKNASLSSSEDISIYPNPAQTAFEIFFTNSKQQNVDIHIFSLDGKFVDLVFSGQLMEGKQKINHLIDVDRLTPGAYIVKIESSDMKLMQQLIIQQ